MKLKPCPCGSTNLLKDTVSDWWFILCKYCKYQKVAETEREVIKKWNN